MRVSDKCDTPREVKLWGFRGVIEYKIKTIMEKYSSVDWHREVTSPNRLLWGHCSWVHLLKWVLSGIHGTSLTPFRHTWPPFECIPPSKRCTTMKRIDTKRMLSFNCLHRHRLLLFIPIGKIMPINKTDNSQSIHSNSHSHSTFSYFPFVWLFIIALIENDCLRNQHGQLFLFCIICWLCFVIYRLASKERVIGMGMS